MASRQLQQRSGPRGRAGALLTVVLAVLPFLLGVLAGNQHGLHLSSTGAFGSAAVSVAAVEGDAVDPPAVSAPSAGAEMPGHGAAQHVLHLLGACLGVLLVAGAAWVAALVARRGAPRGAGLRVPAPVQAVVGQVLRAAWRPPPMAPPVTSPVVRT